MVARRKERECFKKKGVVTSVRYCTKLSKVMPETISLVLPTRGS